MYNDKTDDHRLGFVAFSRAKEVLCIARLKTIDSTNKIKLDSLNLIVMEMDNYLFSNNL